MNPEPDASKESYFAHWPGDWPGRNFVDLDCVGDPGAWLEQQLSSVEEVLSADPQEDASTAEALAGAYITPLEETGYSLPSDFEGTPEETREMAVADFVGFIREWRKRSQAKLP